MGGVFGSTKRCWVGVNRRGAEGKMLRGRGSVAWKGKCCVEGKALCTRGSGISAAQEEGRLAVTLHSYTPLVLASQMVPRLPRPFRVKIRSRSCHRQPHPARVKLPVERSTPTHFDRVSPHSRSMAPPLARLSQDRFRRTSSPFSVSTDTSRRMCHATKGNRPTNARFSSMKEMLCVMDGYDAPIERFAHNAAADDGCTLMQCAL